ncbi:MAG: PDZ domain-containing protein, partial [Spirochaetota bacterium]|nr:PDZ domain-containing protein [Spirochaetota bacterium]
MNQFLEKPLYQNHNDKQQNWLRSKKSKIIFSILIIIVIFGLGFFTGSRYRPSIDKITDLINLEKGKPVEVDFSLFWDVWLRVQNDYFNRKNLDPQQMVYEAISGMVRATGDPHTVFFDPEETKRFKEEIEGESFEGIGAEIGIRKGILTIIAPLEGSPAQKAGLRSGDKILKINDQFTVDLTVDEAISLIRGPKGSEIILTVVRDSKDTKEIIVKRDTIKIPIAQWEKKEKTAYIRLYSFTENSSEEFQKVAQQVLNSNIESIVLDL